jgi:hypothetical protein
MNSAARRTSLCIGAACAVLGVSGWLALRARSASESALPPAAERSPARDATLAGSAPAEGGERASVDVAAASGEEASAPEAQTEQAPAAVDPEAELVHARDELRTALEASLLDSLDPSAILDAAFSLGSLEVDPRPFSEPDPSGCMVYTLMGAPEGTRAELWVGRSSKPDVAQVLSLRFELDPQEPPYFLDGCARAKAIAQVQMQIGKDGSPLNLTILTDLPPSGRNRGLDVPLETGSISQGVLCFVDAKDPANWRARTHGLDEGKPGSWENTTLLLASNLPTPERLDAFSDLLQRQYETIRH